MTCYAGSELGTDRASLDFVLSLIRCCFLPKFLLLFRKLLRGAANCHCRCLGNALHICLHHHSLLICLQLPTLFETSQSCPVLSSTRKSLGVDFAFRLVSVSLLATGSFTVSDFESSQSLALVVLPAVGYVLVLPFVGDALVLLAVGCALSVLLIFTCCWVCSSRGPPTRIVFFLLLTTGSLALVLSLLPPASICGSLRLRSSPLSPPTSLLSIKSLRDWCLTVDALVPWTGSSQQSVLLMMRIGFSFAHYFFLTCSAEMSVSLFTGCVHPHKVRVFIAASDSGQQSHTRCRRLLRCVGWCSSIRTAVSCDRSSCAAVSLALLCCFLCCTAVRASPHL